MSFDNFEASEIDDIHIAFEYTVATISRHDSQSIRFPLWDSVHGELIQFMLVFYNECVFYALIKSFNFLPLSAVKLPLNGTYKFIVIEMSCVSLYRNYFLYVYHFQNEAC